MNAQPLDAPRWLSLRWLGYAAILSMVALVAYPATAAPLDADLPTAVAEEAPLRRNDYKLAAGDHVIITVFDQPDLSGDFVIDFSGAVALPLIGAVNAEGFTTTELQDRIAVRLADGYLQSPVVNVRTGELRPIYVVGAVSAPGSYPYRHGASVLSAIALAGGLAITPNEEAVLRNELLLADERLKVLEVTHASMVARRLRLEAQRDGEAEVDFSSLRGVSDSPRFSKLIEGEREIFASQIEAQVQDVAVLQEQRPHLESEIAALDEQAAQEQTQLDLITTQVNEYEKLYSNGLARKAALVDLQRAQAASRAALARFKADAAKARLTLSEIALNVRRSADAYKRRVMTELQDTELKLMEIEASLPLARESAEIKRRQLAMKSGQSRDAGRAILISRFSEGAVKTFEADETSILVPGDIVQVGSQLMGNNVADASGTNPLAATDVTGSTSQAQ